MWSLKLLNVSVLIQCKDWECVSGRDSVWYNARIMSVFLGVILSDTMHGFLDCFWVWFCLIRCIDYVVCFRAWFCLIKCKDCESVFLGVILSDTMHGLRDCVSGRDSVWYNARIFRLFLGAILFDTMHGLCRMFLGVILSDTMHGLRQCVSVWYNALIFMRPDITTSSAIWLQRQCSLHVFVR
jgi:uncharacterized metal-binding protein